MASLSPKGRSNCSTVRKEGLLAPTSILWRVSTVIPAIRAISSSVNRNKARTWRNICGTEDSECAASGERRAASERLCHP